MLVILNRKTNNNEVYHTPVFYSSRYLFRSYSRTFVMFYTQLIGPLSMKLVVESGHKGVPRDSVALGWITKQFHGTRSLWDYQLLSCCYPVILKSQFIPSSRYFLITNYMKHYMRILYEIVYRTNIFTSTVLYLKCLNKYWAKHTVFIFFTT